jgi:hypothetical protein
MADESSAGNGSNQPADLTPAPDGEVDLIGGQPIETTVAGILGVVGDDADLAAAYLERERAAEKPRTSLVPRLEQIAGATGAEEEVTVELLGVSHNAGPGSTAQVTRERAEELRAAGLARVVE